MSRHKRLQIGGTTCLFAKSTKSLLEPMLFLIKMKTASIILSIDNLLTINASTETGNSIGLKNLLTNHKVFMLKVTMFHHGTQSLFLQTGKSMVTASLYTSTNKMNSLQTNLTLQQNITL